MNIIYTETLKIHYESGHNIKIPTLNSPIIIMLGNSSTKVGYLAIVTKATLRF